MGRGIWQMMNAKQTVESCDYLSATEVKNIIRDYRPFDSPAVLSVTLAYVLVHRGTGERTSITDRLTLEPFQRRYGYSYFFRCPTCGRRALKLYRAGSVYRCRDCGNLNYESSQASGSTWKKGFLAEVKLQRHFEAHWKRKERRRHVVGLIAQVTIRP